ncbi:MAG: biotin transporter BioY [Eubacteriales bacterium]|nr:biotin transporter BioY [Eubacteriales bacterium]
MLKYKKLKEMCIISLLCGILCIISPFSIPIPFSVVPISFSNLIIYLISIIFDINISTYAILIYIILGVCGLPVFSNFGSGLSKIVGPTGGYIIAYIFIPIIIYKISKIFSYKKVFVFLSLLLATCFMYLVGTLHLCIILKIRYIEAFYIGVVPYIIIDIIKMIIALFLGLNIKNKIKMYLIN